MTVASYPVYAKAYDTITEHVLLQVYMNTNLYLYIVLLSLSVSHQHHGTLPYQYTITHPFLSLHLYLCMFLSINQCILFYHMMAM